LRDDITEHTLRYTHTHTCHNTQVTVPGIGLALALALLLLLGPLLLPLAQRLEALAELALGRRHLLLLHRDCGYEKGEREARVQKQ